MLHLRAVEEDTHDLAGDLFLVSLDDEWVDVVTNLLSIQLLHLGSCLHWHLALEASAHAWEVSLHHHGLHHWLLTPWALGHRAATGIVVGFSATTAMLVAATTLTAAGIHSVIFSVVLGWVEELSHLTPLALVAFLCQLFGGLPELDVEEARTKHVGLVKFLDCFFGGINLRIEDEVRNVSWISFNLSLTCSSFS